MIINGQDIGLVTKEEAKTLIEDLKTMLIEFRQTEPDNPTSTTTQEAQTNLNIAIYKLLAWKFGSDHLTPEEENLGNAWADYIDAFRSNRVKLDPKLKQSIMDKQDDLQEQKRRIAADSSPSLGA